jgi:branched-chain amino acid transport system permease protein
VEAFLNFTIIGIITGAIYAVAASGLVVTYTTSGIFNFAHGAIGMVMAFMYWELRVNHHWPAPFALVVVLLVLSPLVGALIERLLMRNLRGGDTGTSLVVTVGLLLVLIGFAQIVWPPNTVRALTPFFGDSHIRILGLNVSYHQITMLLTAVAVAILLRFILYRTRPGIAMRAVVDDRNLAALNGAQPYRVSQMSWALGSTLAAAAGILLAPQLNLEVFALTFLVVKGYAAAMVGKLVNLPLTFAGAVALGLVESYARWKLPNTGFWPHITANLPTIFLLVVVVALPAVRLRAGRVVTMVAPRVPGRREATAGGLALVLVGVVAANVLHGSNLSLISNGVGISIILLSLVLLTGYGGQISLAHFTIAGVGAFTFGKLAPGGGPLALVAVAGVCAVVGALIALPALRLQGLYLALLTLAIAVLADSVFFLDSHVLGRGQLNIHRLSIPGLSASGAKANLILLVAIFALGGSAVLAIRRGPFGRLLGAMRDSPAACATLGLDLTRVKLGVFALSAAMCGVGGALWGASKGAVTGLDFIYVQSLVLLLILTIGGVNTITGAFLGGLFLAVANIVNPHLPERYQQLTLLATGLGAMTIARNPNGVAGLLALTADQVRTRLRGRPPAPAAIPEEVGIAASAG